MNWTGILASHTLLLLVTMTTLVSPFLYYSKGQLLDPSIFDEEPEDEGIYKQPSSSSSSSSSSSMMAVTNPRIGARSSLSDTCHVNPVRLTVRPPPRFADRCAPTTAISYGCRGGCSSYTRVDVRNTTNLLRSCSCCAPTGFGFRLIKMKCINFGFRALVKFALGCHCRPCLASVESADVQTLRDLLRRTSLLT